MTVTSGGANVFHWFSSLVTIAYLLTWTSICFAYTRFRRALIHNQINRATLPFKSPGQPYIAWGGLTYFVIILIFNGFPVFTHGNWNVLNFVSAYIGLMYGSVSPSFVENSIQKADFVCSSLYAAFYIGWKVVKRTKVVPISEIDLFTGRVNDMEHNPPPRDSSMMRDILSKVWGRIV